MDGHLNGIVVVGIVISVTLMVPSTLIMIRKNALITSKALSSSMTT